MNKLKLVLLVFVCIGAYCCSESQASVIENHVMPPDPTSESGGENSGTTPSDESDSNDLSGSDYNLLFIGNSLTYTNDLPALVRIEGKSKGLNLGTKMIAFPNYAILDHWSDGEVQNEIASKKYNFVIIQQGPSSQAFGREVLIEYGKKYSALCKENDAELVYFMVWPSLTYYRTFDGVITNHREAATLNNAILCPVGEVWKAHFDNTDNFDYYGPDGFHPSLLGSQVAAEVIIATLFP